MSKRKHSEVFAKVCVGAQSVIVAALCLAGLLPALLLSAFLRGPWCLAGFTTLLLVAGLPLLGKWPGRGLLLDSIGTGFRDPDQSGAQAPNGSGSRASAARGGLLPVFGPLIM